MISLQAQIEKIETREDNTIKIVVGTQEISSQNAMELFDLRKKVGWFLFSDNPIQASDVPKDTAEFDNEKSPSRRLKATLYVFWQKEMKGKYPDFEQYYRTFMEKKISEIKEKLA